MHPEQWLARARPAAHAALQAAVAALLLGTAGAGGAHAQAANPPVVQGRVATPVEITMRTVNGRVACGPPRARLPARVPLTLHVVNRSQAPLWFLAPKFFRHTRHYRSTGFTFDVRRGGFLVAPRRTATVLLRTPASGRYSYSCAAPGRVPNPASSGFLIVVPAANRPTR
jgi:hypothetical protein